MKYLLIIALTLIGCTNSEEDYERGLDDGYAVGYNTTCEIKSSVISAEWINKHYYRGYQEGYDAGSQACISEKR